MTSRRKFLKAGMFAAMFAAVPVKEVLGRADARLILAPIVDNDPLSNYTEATFKSYLRSVFSLHTVYGIVEVTLVEVKDLPSSPGGECFSLLFRGGSRALKQDTYVIDHPALGTFKLFLVPSGADKKGTQSYLATLNRLSYAQSLMNPPPERIVSDGPKPESE